MRFTQARQPNESQVFFPSNEFPSRQLIERLKQLKGHTLFLFIGLTQPTKVRSLQAFSIAVL
jgi:hypothetical protein